MRKKDKYVTKNAILKAFKPLSLLEQCLYAHHFTNCPQIRSKCVIKITFLGMLSEYDKGVEANTKYPRGYYS